MPTDIPLAFPVIRRKSPMEFETWRNIVLQNGMKYVSPKMLVKFYEDGWDAEECILMIVDCGFYIVPPVEQVRKEQKKYRPVVYERMFVEKRLALAMWKECGRLLGRNLAPEARALVIETKEKMEAVLIRD